MKKSKGSRRGTRQTMRKKVRQKGIPPITHYLQEFKKGDKVHVKLLSSEAGKGMPHPRFQGKTGTVLGKQGNSYKVQVTEGNATKTIIITSVHLKPCGKTKGGAGKK